MALKYILLRKRQCDWYQSIHLFLCLKCTLLTSLRLATGPSKCRLYLDRLWKESGIVNGETKVALCRQTWNLISEIRTVPRPPELQEGPYQCDTNGFPTDDPLLADLDLKFPRPLTSDKEVRDRIYERYLHFGGRQYKDQLPNLLPQSESSVFTHADIAPRNIMVDERNFITGILDWGSAGWYPDYWEYAQISRPSIKCRDWPGLMERTAPRTWDLTGIHAVRNILF